MTHRETKRRKVWVTWQNTDGGGGGCGPNLYVDTEKTSGAKPFIEARPGDVVLSREQRKTLAVIVKWMDDSADGRFKVIVEPELRALLRGGR